MPSVTAASIGIVLLIPLVYLVLAAVPLLCCPRAFGRGQGDVFARSVLVAVPIGLVPAVEVAYFASDAAVIASLSMGSAIAVAAFVYTLLREKRDNNSDTPRTSGPFDAGVFSPALSPREEQFVRLLLKGKTPAEIARETGTKPSTVRTTLHRAYGKASVAGSRELVALFVDEGDAVVPELSRRHADDMLASARTRRLFRYLLTLFFILLAAGPLVMADSDWGSGVSWAVAFSLSSYALGLGLLLSLHYAGEKLNREAALTRTDGAIGLGSPCVWAILSAVEWSFVYIAAWRCVRDPLMAVPVLFCGIASMASLAVKLCPFKVHTHTRAIAPLVSIGVAALIYAATTCGTDGDAAHIYSAGKLSAAQNARGMDALLWGDGSCLGCLAQHGAGSDGFRAVVPCVVAGAKFGCQCRRGNGDRLLVCAHVRHAHRARPLG